jgi:hypothetical protein
MPYAAAFSVGGLVLNLFGVLLLFRYGMPFRVATGASLPTLQKNLTKQKSKRTTITNGLAI